MSRLISLDAAFARLGPLAPVTPCRIAPAEALGRRAAEDVFAPFALPAQAEALIAGVAVASADLVGASAAAPAVLMRAPVAVAAGEALPPGCDAVIAPQAVTGERAPYEVSQPAYPGLGVRLAAGDLAAGSRIVAAGALLRPEHLPALALTGTAVAVRRPRVRLDSVPHADFVAAVCRAHGAVLVGADADLHLAGAAPLPRGIALRPGEEAGAGLVDGTPTILLPARIDGIAAALHALVVPALDALGGLGPESIEVPLIRKVVSEVGSSDLALFRLEAAGATPLAVGDIALSALLAADAIAILPPDSEGLPAGARLAVRPLLGHAPAP